MENCSYQGKVICTYDLKDKNGIYYEDLVLHWKQAAADRQLTCEECGAPVYLAAGPVKEPYFAHYDLEECDYGKGHETEQLKKGKRLLYHFLKQSLPDADIRARYRMDNGMYSTLFCQTKNGKALAVDYRLQNNSLEKYQERNNFYQSYSIKTIYILGIERKKETNQIDWYQHLLQTSMGYLLFLDTDKECLTLKKSFGYRLGNERKFLSCSKTYPVNSLMMDSDGQINCDFIQRCLEIENQIRAEKDCYEKNRDQLKKLREESQKLQVRDFSGSKNLFDCHSDLNPIILEKCRKMIAEGNAHLVSKKYYEAIMQE